MNLYEEHALLKALNKLFPETTNMTVKEITVHIYQMAGLKQSLNYDQERGINEAFTHFTDSHSGV